MVILLCQWDTGQVPGFARHRRLCRGAPRTNKLLHSTLGTSQLVTALTLLLKDNPEGRDP